MVLKVGRQANGEYYLSVSLDVGHGLAFRDNRRNVSRETYRTEVAALLDNTVGIRSRLQDVVKAAGLAKRGGG